MIIPVILSGGSGTRLWPLSTPEKPKQFLALVSERTLFQETLLRLQGLPDLADPIIVCNEAHRLLVTEQLAEIEVKAAAVILEPEGRNTAPAIGVAAMMAQGSDPISATAELGSDPMLLVLPADHVIADTAAFHSAVAKAIAAAETGKLVTFGIVPTHAETGYGYIEQGSDAGDCMLVERFVEKPDLATAARYVESGQFLWNSGMFCFRADVLLAELERCSPDIFAACRSTAASAAADEEFTRLGPEFLSSPSDSIDYAVMEKTDQAAVVSLDAGWSDVGSWAALHEVLHKDRDGNAIRGEVVSLNAKDSLVFAGSRKIALLGLDDVVVIETGDTVLIMSKDSSQDVKEIQKRLESNSS